MKRENMLYENIAIINKPFISNIITLKNQQQFCLQLLIFNNIYGNGTKERINLRYKDVIDFIGIKFIIK